LNELALFAGAGGGILGGKLLGWRTVCAVEWETYPASVLCARQNDGLFPPFPIWDDVQTFDGRPWRGIVDVVSGGFPCQDISAAGKGAGIDGERSGMWGEMARIICEVRPRFVFVENSPMLTSRGLGRVLGDLASMGFDAKWGVLGAADVGAPHQRDRIWIVAKWRGQLSHAQHDRIGRWEQQQESPKETTGNLANTNGITSQVRGNDFANEAIGGKRDNNSSRSRSNDWGQFDAKKNEQMAFTKIEGLERWTNSRDYESSKSRLRESGWAVKRNWLVEPNVGRVADGVAARVDRLKAIGNGQVPLCAATAWRILSES
jgi:DNA (cytosine-5)-methyltransferase 1